jgi:hypothetical protein
MDKTKAPNDIIFRTGSKIIAYDGELVNSDALEDRYGDKTAPYGIHIKRHLDLLILVLLPSCPERCAQMLFYAASTEVVL